MCVCACARLSGGGHRIDDCPRCQTQPSVRVPSKYLRHPKCLLLWSCVRPRGVCCGVCAAPARSVPLFPRKGLSWLCTAHSPRPGGTCTPATGRDHPPPPSERSYTPLGVPRKGSGNSTRKGSTKEQRYAELRARKPVQREQNRERQKKRRAGTLDPRYNSLA